MKNRAAASILAFALLGFFVQAQSPVADSLKVELVGMKDDSNKVKLLNDLAKSVFRFAPDTTLVYTDRSIEVAKKVNYQTGLGYALKNKGLAYYVQGDFTKVLQYWQESLSIFESIDDKLGVCNLLNNLGAVHFSKGDDPKALDYYINSMRMAEELGDKRRIATAHVNIGAVYVNTDATWDLALEAYEKSLKLCREIDYQEGIGTAAMNLGEVYDKKGNTEKAVEYFDKAIAAFEKTGGSISMALNMKGANLLKEGKANLAISQHLLALERSKSKDAKAAMAKSNIGLGNAYREKKQSKIAIDKYNEALELTKVTDVKIDYADAYEGLSLTYAELNDYENAFTYQSLFTAMEDSMRSDEYGENISNLRFQFDFENKEKEITLLNKDNAIKESEIARTAIFQKFLYALAGLLFFIVGGLSYQWWYVKKSHRLLERERNRSESILLNILPKDTADELKANGFVEAKKFEQTTVMFTDFKEFTRISDRIIPEDLVKSVDYYFRKFDEIVDKHGLEKIKTIGDAYMCAGGLPSPNDTNAEDAFKAALEMLAFVKKTRIDPPKGISAFDIRIGLNTGPVVAGVVGTKKFQYDIWGNTVNIASRMESNSEPGKINISENTFELLGGKYPCIYRGEFEVKNAGIMKMYFADDEAAAV